MKITSDELRLKMKNGDKFIVDMYAEWCGPCRIMGTIVEKYSDKLKSENSEVSIYKFDIEEGRELAAELGIRSIPTIKGFSGGKEVISRSGVLQEPQLDELKEALL